MLLQVYVNRLKHDQFSRCETCSDQQISCFSFFTRLYVFVGSLLCRSMKRSESSFSSYYVVVRAFWVRRDEETDLVKLDPELSSALQRCGERVQILPPKRKELLYPQTAQGVVSRVPDAVFLPD